MYAKISLSTKHVQCWNARIRLEDTFAHMPIFCFYLPAVLQPDSGEHIQHLNTSIGTNDISS